ncbi:hypothetical protein, partial [Massilia niastensis]|uniref:hypothetical protein n=1 Tax=Massilia niastensis TaxID=544911 RepID=UPI001B7F7E57
LASLLVKPASTAQLRPREKYRLNQRFPRDADGILTCAVEIVLKESELPDAARARDHTTF